MDGPNLQCVPRPGELTLDPSLPPPDNADSQPLNQHQDNPGAAAAGGLQQHSRLESYNIRSAFRAPPGRVILSADYCQMELRLMAHFSQVRAWACGILRLLATGMRNA